MLLTKTVMVKWNGNNGKYYENKGYIFTRQNEEFEVKVEDLSKGSNIIVEVKCDNPDCSNPYLELRWADYKRRIHNDGKYYCNSCAMKLYGGKKASKTKLKNSISFEQWCYKNLSIIEANKILSRWNYELNKCKPSDICYSSTGTNRKGFWFNCEKGIHEPEIKKISRFTSKASIIEIECKKCNSFAQWGIDNLGEDFLEKYWDYEKNNELGIDPWEISYGSSKKVSIKCQEKNYHKNYITPCKSFVKGSRCPYCSNKNGKVHSLDSLGKLLEDRGLLDLWSNRNEKSPYKYSPKSHNKVWWRCADGKHEDYHRDINNSNTLEFRCPECVQECIESILQEKVRLYLESLKKYTILHEHNCTIVPSNPKFNGNGGQMPFDNEIKELKLIIEVMGIQHYKICKFHKMSSKKSNTTPKYQLHMTQVRDRYKKYVANKNNYNYIDIPYWVDNAREEWKELIDNKINEILNNCSNF